MRQDSEQDVKDLPLPTADAATDNPTRRLFLKTLGAGAVTVTLGRALPAARAFSLRPPAAAPPGPTLPPVPRDVVTPAVPRRVQPFDLADVRLLPGPFRDAMDRDGRYLLFLEPDRLLHNFRVNAGLPPKAPLYGGWEAEGVAGHILGHYLSACSLMYRSTGDVSYRQRVDQIVGDLALCQRQDPTGLVTAIPDAKAIFAKVAADGTMTGWVPWYTMHKLFAGLRDAHLLCGSAPAKEVLVRLADWADATTHGLRDDQFQRMLETEHGGMAESLADVYALTGEPKYLALAHRFTHHAVFDPLAGRQDRLDGLHSNTQIPKLIGYGRIYELTGEDRYGVAPEFFWQTVTGTRSYAIGGNGDFEHFFPPGQFGQHLSSDDQAETCCTYNMLKLTRQLFQHTPSASYADYSERALLNHILASQEPVRGQMMYFAPMKPGHFKVYGDPTEAFWCCTGTGIENHAKYGDSIYFHDAEALYVNLFIASELRWHEKSLVVRQETQFPERDTTRLTLTCARPTKLALKVRYPSWAQGMTVAVNGKRVKIAGGPGSYVTVDRTWRDGDTVEARLPMALHLEPLPHTPDRAAVLYGPVVLAGAMGREGMDQLPDSVRQQDIYNSHPALPAPAFVAEPSALLSHFQPVPAQPLTFRSAGLGQPEDVTLIPYYRTHHQRYNLYWSVYSPDEWARQKAALADEQRARAALDARTVDEFRPGEQQSEVDHQLLSDNSRTGDAQDRHWRDAAGGWFSFVLKVDPSAAMELACTYWGGEVGARTFDILVNDAVVGTQTLNSQHPGQFFDVVYPIPAALMQGKQAVTVKFQAKPANIAGGLFGCRTLRRTPTIAAS